jgi:3'-phosphoadenosine 5'-phosphosulfate sulfotransferase (PAPS reductase)/FAD synthetase
VIVQEDLRIVDSLPIMRLADLDANAMTPIDGIVWLWPLITIDTSWYTPKIVHDFVNDWVTQLKYDFQHMRLTNKRGRNFSTLYSGECTGRL